MDLVVEPGTYQIVVLREAQKLPNTEPHGETQKLPNTDPHAETQIRKGRAGSAASEHLGPGRRHRQVESDGAPGRADARNETKTFPIPTMGDCQCKWPELRQKT